MFSFVYVQRGGILRFVYNNLSNLCISWFLALSQQQNLNNNSLNLKIHLRQQVNQS